MAEKDTITTKVKLDISDLRQNITEANNKIKLLNAEFKATTAGMDDWTKSVDGVSAKLQQLKGLLVEQTKKLESYTEQLKRAEKAEKENAQRADELRAKLKQLADNGVKKTSAEYKKYKSALNEVEKEQLANKRSADQLKITLANQKGTVNGLKKDIDKYESTLSQLNGETEKTTQQNKKLNKSFEDTKKGVNQAKEGFTVFKGVLSQLITNALLRTVQSISSAISSARELRKELGMLNATATTTGSSFEKAQDNMIKVAAITDDTGAAVEGLNNLMAAGFDGKFLDDITDQLVGASIKWKDTLKFEGLADGLQETLATGKAIGPFAEMLERGGLSLDVFNRGLADCSSEAEKQQYILETLSSMGLTDVKNKYEEVNGSLIENNKAALENQAAFAKVNGVLEPLSTKLLNLGATIIEKLQPALERFVDTLTNAANSGNGEKLADSLAKGFSFLIDYVIIPVTKFFKFLIDNLPTVISLFATLTARMLAMNVAAMVTKLVEAYRAFKLATQGATIAQAALNAVMTANPIGLIITAIGLLVTAFITLWNKSEAFRNFWIGLWESIKKAFAPVIEFIKKAFADIVEIFAQLPSKMTEIGKNIITGLWDGIKSAVSWLGEKCKELGNTVINWFKGIFGIHSPSTVFADIGKNLLQGLWNGISSMVGTVKDKVSNFAKSLVTKVKDGISNITQQGKNFANKLWSGVSSVAGSVKNKVSTFAKGLVTTVKNGISNVKNVGENLVKGVWNGINSWSNWISGKIKGWAGNIVKWAKNALGIKSPSKVFEEEVGEMIGEGMGLGILDSTKTVLNDMDKFLSKIKNGLGNKLNTINGGLSINPNYAGVGAGATSNVNNFTQIINAPKQPSRIELYRQTKNLLALKGGY